MVKAVLEEDMVRCAIPLSNTTSHLISGIQDYVDEHLINTLKTSKTFAIQLDDSTDVTNFSILIIHVHSINSVIKLIEGESILNDRKRNFPSIGDICYTE
jgi:hypothetical protein